MDWSKHLSQQMKPHQHQKLYQGARNQAKTSLGPRPKTVVKTEPDIRTKEVQETRQKQNRGRNKA